MENTEKEIIYIYIYIVPFRSYPTGYRKFEKNNKKTWKLKYTIMASFQAKIAWKRQRERENKKYRSVSFLHNRKLQKNSKKIQKIKKYHYCFI